MIPTAPPSPITTPHLHLYGSIVINHHTTTSTAPPSSITTPPPKCFSLTVSASHHTHYTIRKPKPISADPQPLMNAEELMNPDTATARSIFPPLLINLDQPPKSHRNKNSDIADQPRSQQEKKKKKKPKSTLIKTQTPSLLDQCFLHR